MVVTMKIGPVEIGTQKLLLNCNEFTFNKVEALREAVAQIRREHSIFSKYPMEEGEKRELWKVRVEPIMEADMTRKEGETPLEHLKRMFELKSDSHEMAPQILSTICETFGLREVSAEDFKKANWLEVKSFIYDTLNVVDISCDDFAPKRPMGTVGV